MCNKSINSPERKYRRMFKSKKKYYVEITTYIANTVYVEIKRVTWNKQTHKSPASPCFYFPLFVFSFHFSLFLWNICVVLLAAVFFFSLISIFTQKSRILCCISGKYPNYFIHLHQTRQSLVFIAFTNSLDKRKSWNKSVT